MPEGYVPRISICLKKIKTTEKHDKLLIKGKLSIPATFAQRCKLGVSKPMHKSMEGEPCASASKQNQIPRRIS